MFPRRDAKKILDTLPAPQPVGPDWKEIEAKGLARIPVYHKLKAYHKDVLRWLGTEPTATGEPVSAHRVWQPLNTFHEGISYTSDMGIPDGADPEKWADEFCADVGLCMELRRADGEVVYKTTPPQDTTKTFI